MAFRTLPSIFRTSTSTSWSVSLRSLNSLRSSLTSVMSLLSNSVFLASLSDSAVTPEGRGPLFLCLGTLSVFLDLLAAFPEC